MQSPAASCGLRSPAKRRSNPLSYHSSVGQLQLHETAPTPQAQLHGDDIVPTTEQPRLRRQPRESRTQVLDDGVTTDYTLSPFTEDGLRGRTAAEESTGPRG